MQFPLLNIFLTMVWFFLMVMWFWLVIRVIGDVFRDDTLGGGAKAAWAIFVICLPFLGVFVYLMARGSGMGGRESAREYRRETLQTAGTGDDRLTRAQTNELVRLADLKNHGDLTNAEYDRAKSHVLSG
ncbi:PLD nuclease N-terminal domain-containing protein [Actinomadura coerulea]|uniref:PLD nuclease N-terminal domain-containing protein n=1 Tax=Actinomadura coerulea TaxID=46159 RepID=UPI003425E842